MLSAAVFSVLSLVVPVEGPTPPARAEVTWTEQTTGLPPVTYVWSLSAKDAWAVGGRGVLLHGNGKKWEVVEVPTKAPLRGVWASSPKDVWVVGSSGAVLHSDGKKWTAMDTGAPHRDQVWAGVWGSGPKDVWMASRAGVVLHYDGKSFTSTAVTAAPYRGISGTGPKDVVALGGAVAAHYDGKTWTAQGVAGWPTTLWRPAKDDVWAVGDATLLHREGDAWKPYRAVVTAEPRASTNQSGWEVRSISGGACDIWASTNEAILHFDGKVWSDVTGNLRAKGGIPLMVASDRGGTFALAGSASYMEGAVAAPAKPFKAPGKCKVTSTEALAMLGIMPGEPAGPPAPPANDPWLKESPAYLGMDVRGLWGSGDDDIWAGGYEARVLLHKEGASWRAYQIPVQGHYHHGWSMGAADAWAVGYAPSKSSSSAPAALHFDGKEWSAKTLPDMSGELLGAWGSGPNDVWFVGRFEGVLHHAPGASGAAEFSLVPVQGSFQSIWGSGPKDVWAVGSRGAMAHWDGEKWAVQVPMVEDDLVSVWGSSGKDVWAVGRNLSILRYDGTRWSRVRHDVISGLINVHLHAVTGTGPSDVWVVGQMPYALHFDGANWTLETGVRNHNQGSMPAAWAHGSTVYSGATGGVFRRDVKAPGLPVVRDPAEELPIPADAEPRTGMEFLPLPATRLQVGCRDDPCTDGKPHTEVKLPPFTMGKNEVSAMAYLKCYWADGCKRPHIPDWPRAARPGVMLDADKSVDHVTQEEAAAFCAWMGARLPTADEWEAAAKSQTRFDGMIGGKAEWTSTACPDGQGFVLSGGATTEDYNLLHAAGRVCSKEYLGSQATDQRVGFRCARSAAPAPKSGKTPPAKTK